MARRREDDIDVLCKAWASVRRKVLGLTDPRLAREYIGALRCTLAARRDLHLFSSSGKLEQDYPEVYTEDALTVHRCFSSMPEKLRWIMDTHYVLPGTVGLKLQFSKLKADEYWGLLEDAKRKVASGC